MSPRRVRRLGLTLLALAGLAAGMWVFGPYEPVDLSTRFDPATLTPDPVTYLRHSEAEVGDVLPHAEKRIQWAGAPGQKTPLAVVYLHGFSATAQEIRPVPDRVAQALGANLFFTRYTGHGRADPDALAQGSVNAWLRDTAQALAIGRAIGDRVLIVATSTGATLAALALTQPDLRQDVAGAVFVSPNFGINDPRAALLTLPAARYVLPPLLGARRSWTPQNPAHARYWTTDYPSVAVLPVAAAVQAAQRADYSAVDLPLLAYFAPADRVVDATQTLALLPRWAGPVTVRQVTLGPGNDPHSHVLAGQALSPGNTQAAITAILNWTKGL